MKFADDLRESADGCTFGSELMDIADQAEKCCMELPIGADGEPIALGDQGRRTSSETILGVDGFINHLGDFKVVLSDGGFVLPEDFTHEEPYDVEKLLADLEDLRRSMEQCVHDQGSTIHFHHAYRLGEIIKKGKQI